jgi:hypothetical protein
LLAAVSTYLLVVVAGLAIASAVLSAQAAARPRSSVIELVAVGAALSLLAGGAILGRPLLLQARRGPAGGVASALAFAVGLAAAGAVLALAWTGLVAGLPVLLRRRADRGPGRRDGSG